MKFIRKPTTQEKLILCTNLHTDQTLKMEIQPEANERMLTAYLDELVSKKCIKLTYYQSFTRGFLSNKNTDKQSVDQSNAF